MSGETNVDRRLLRREATKAEILAAAWAIARSEGLAAVVLRDVARSVGMRSPSLYGYFESKNSIFDAMYAQGCREFSDGFPRQQLTGELRHDLRLMLHYFVRFCAADPARYQLMFQRTIPGFEPTPESFALSVAGLTEVADHLARSGVTGSRAIDLYTALGTGLADQQISNDPGGDRWIGLVDEAVDMFVSHLSWANGRGPNPSGPSPNGATPERKSRS